MNITIDCLKRTYQALGYKWLGDCVQLIGIRSSLNAPDIYNDVLCVVYPSNGKDVIRYFDFTTDPGVTYQMKFLNPKGCLVMKPGQYIDAYMIGHHQNKLTHRALIQVGPVTVYRDADRDGFAEAEGFEETGLYGANIHGAIAESTTGMIGPWSAGCQVHQTWSAKEEMMNICENFKGTRNRFTYVLLDDKQLIP